MVIRDLRVSHLAHIPILIGIVLVGLLIEVYFYVHILFLYILLIHNENNDKFFLYSVALVQSVYKNERSMLLV